MAPISNERDGWQNQKAIKIAKSVAASAPNSQPSFLWKEYVLANIAFLEGDNKALLKNRNLIAKHKEHKPNAMNLVIVYKLINNIKKCYLDTYSI
ncbi:hypothetical protein [Pseudoalteromonas umbrosa]|uniref:hypothetical protein n=1 Tax=Pseudoalteromonas umbrosa TaxID=3048489 RepID=UPI0024C31F32|nr:hypothetical protein [Pseudoalteromonas sp. B95]MDK1288269.1 hypothetical protein [Pseudoalteromonas sp. B95]